MTTLTLINGGLESLPIIVESSTADIYFTSTIEVRVLVGNKPNEFQTFKTYKKNESFSPSFGSGMNSDRITVTDLAVGSYIKIQSDMPLTSATLRWKGEDALLITPMEVGMLSRPCTADEQKVMRYISEAEQNNIKPAIGDDLYIQLKEGRQAFLLEGGIYERNGKRYYLNGIKKALAYFVISHLYESSTTELTRQGAVNRRSEYSDNADERERLSVSRETYAIANRYMEEVERYLGTEVKNTSQRVRFEIIGGQSTQRQCRPSVSGGASPSSPSANIKVFQTLGDSDKDVISQAGVTREFNAIRDEIKNIEAPTLSKLAKVAETGDYNDLKNKPAIPSVEGLASEAYVDEKVNAIDVPEALSELATDASHRLVTDTEKAAWNAKSNFSGDYNDLENKPNIPSLDGYATELWVSQEIGKIDIPSLDGYATESYVRQHIGTKQDKTVIVTATDAVSIDKRSVIDVTGNVVINLESYDEDGYAHSYEIVLNVGDTAYSVAFPESVKWAKDLKIETNTTYSIVIEDNLALYAAIKR